MSQGSRNLNPHQLALIEKYNSPSLKEKSILCGHPDIFDGITVDNTDQYPDTVELFETFLNNSLNFWIENKRRGIWIKVPESKAHLISVATRAGFTFHHCQADYIMLTKWIPTELNKLPHYTSHFIGCGGVVINDKNEILLITEKQRPDRWKIPGGALDVGEDLCNTAVREVFEETGIKSEFVSVLGFRQLQNYAFDRADIYYVCALKPLSSEINMDTNEIGQCKWTPIQEFVNLQTPYPLQKAVSRLAYEYCFNGYKGFKASEVANSVKPGNSYLYHGSNANIDELASKVEKKSDSQDPQFNI
ncbi:hypothetical protein DLAC_07459 [Tieghemostelium lacteum]|uniref:Nucleoside diphosphate-linked moiety X motif 6 n=1 Tax=Tieghemostelium lacteum TaxID=361077 RepID=A0A151ZCK7_TIELA|nr:hypothetical protein DLAC_07459 [Tieghemostelium lacteum]|eukprot:KYQ91682.1 hypothetical protein DLAC_07459 [Tieghemostelium lacteum]